MNVARWCLLLCFFLTPPILALLGAMTTLDGGLTWYVGAMIGVFLGCVFACMFGDVKGRAMDAVFGPGKDKDDEHRDSGDEPPCNLIDFF